MMVQQMILGEQLVMQECLIKKFRVFVFQGMKDTKMLLWRE